MGTVGTLVYKRFETRQAQTVYQTFQTTLNWFGSHLGSGSMVTPYFEQCENHEQSATPGPFANETYRHAWQPLQRSMHAVSEASAPHDPLVLPVAMQSPCSPSSVVPQ